jgi:hypothetical protein
MERPNSASASSRLYASLNGRPSTWLHFIVRASARTRRDLVWLSGLLVRKFPRTSLRSTIGIAAGQTAVEYEYRFTEYRPPRRTEYEYDEIRCEARTPISSESIAQNPGTQNSGAIRSSTQMGGVGISLQSPHTRIESVRFAIHWILIQK